MYGGGWVVLCVGICVFQCLCGPEALDALGLGSQAHVADSWWLLNIFFREVCAKILSAKTARFFFLTEHDGAQTGLKLNRDQPKSASSVLELNTAMIFFLNILYISFSMRYVFWKCFILWDTWGRPYNLLVLLVFWSFCLFGFGFGGLVLVTGILMYRQKRCQVWKHQDLVFPKSFARTFSFKFQFTWN